MVDEESKRKRNVPGNSSIGSHTVLTLADDLVCRAIESALGQTRPVDEIIVVDDGIPVTALNRPFVATRIK